MNDPSTGEPVTIIVDPSKKLITDSTVIHVPHNTLTDAEKAANELTVAAADAAAVADAAALGPELAPPADGTATPDEGGEKKEDAPADKDKKEEGKKDAKPEEKAKEKKAEADNA